jgi:hypothetical protein
MGVLLFIGDSKAKTETIPITIIPEPTMQYVLPEPTMLALSIEGDMTNHISIKEDIITLRSEMAEIRNIPTTKELFAKYFPDEDFDKTLNVLAKVLWGEARGQYKKSKTNCAAVVWCILNRVDIGKRGRTPIQCTTASSQFTGYRRSNPVQDHLRELAEDVLGRWLCEKEGEIDVGRVLPKEYIYFAGNGVWNRFRKSNSGKRFIPKHSEVYGD